VVASVNSSLVSLLASKGQDGTSAATGGATTASAAKARLSPAALRHAAASTGAASAAQALETGQRKLGSELRAALAKAGVKLGGAVEFSVSGTGAVDIKASAADKAAMQAFLKADTSQPSFASRIATQARDALKLSGSIQQSAAISQAAKAGKSAAGVMSLYTSLMQQPASAQVVFSLSASASTLSYPGSLTASA
jgi:hypothetical protein